MLKCNVDEFLENDFLEVMHKSKKEPNQVADLNLKSCAVVGGEFESENMPNSARDGDLSHAESTHIVNAGRILVEKFGATLPDDFEISIVNPNNGHSLFDKPIIQPSILFIAFVNNNSVDENVYLKNKRKTEIMMNGGISPVSSSPNLFNSSSQGAWTDTIDETNAPFILLTADFDYNSTICDDDFPEGKYEYLERVNGKTYLHESSRLYARKNLGLT